jgi:hypothetical protein
MPQTSCSSNSRALTEQNDDLHRCGIEPGRRELSVRDLRTLNPSGALMNSSYTASITATVLLCAAVAGQTVDPRMGTWTLNLAKSTYPPGLAPQSQTLKWAPAEDGGFTLTTDGVDAQGQAIHTETTAKTDGKDYPVRGGRDGGPARTRATRRIDDRTFESVDRFTNPNGDVVVLVRMEQFSADGRTMTNTSSRRDSQGQVVRIVAVYDRQ